MIGALVLVGDPLIPRRGRSLRSSRHHLRVQLQLVPVGALRAHLLLPQNDLLLGLVVRVDCFHVVTLLLVEHVQLELKLVLGRELPGRLRALFYLLEVRLGAWTGAAAVPSLLGRLPLRCVVRCWVGRRASLEVGELRLDLLLQVLHAGDVFVHQSAALADGGVNVLQAQGRWLLELVRRVPRGFALLDKQLIGIVVLGHCLARSRRMWRAHADEVLVVLIARWVLMLLPFFVSVEAFLGPCALLVLVALIRRASRPLLYLDHQLLVAASLGVSTSVASVDAVRLELLDMNIMWDRQASVIPSGVNQDLFAVVLVLLGRVPLRLLLADFDLFLLCDRRMYVHLDHWIAYLRRVRPRARSTGHRDA